VQPKAARLSLDANTQAVLAYADGQRSIEDISRESGLGLFMTVKALYELLKRGGVTLEAPASIDARAVRELVASFNEVLRDIFAAVVAHGNVEQTRTTLEAWVHGSGYATIFGPKVADDGALSEEAVAQALAGFDVDEPMRGLQQALHELAVFALFAATTTLPREHELALSRDVNARLKRLRS
jgi:hypothetical protein